MSESSARLEIGKDAFPAASEHLTETVATHLPFHVLVPYKNLLKRYFSAAPWDAGDEQNLRELVSPHLDEGRWEVEVASGLWLDHGVAPDGYFMRAHGGAAATGQDESLFAKAFSGPVVPEATPHPQKVKFSYGGAPAPGLWYQQGEPVSDPRAAALLADPGVTDVMVAGDFVTVGLAPGRSWRDHLDGYLDLVTEVFAGAGEISPPAITRDQMLQAAGPQRGSSPDLHLADPDAAEGRAMLLSALGDADHRRRRIAVAILAESADVEVRDSALRRGFSDERLSVRRTAVDEARTASLRDLLEAALHEADPWIRWRAVRNLAEIGLGASRPAVAALAADADFQVRFEVARVLLAEEVP